MSGGMICLVLKGQLLMSLSAETNKKQKGKTAITLFLTISKSLLFLIDKHN